MKHLPKFCVYKNTGAIQLSLVPANHTEGNEFAFDKGFVMLEMASYTGSRSNNGLATYDWTKKITMKINEVDIQQILTGFREGKAAIVHDPSKANGKASAKKFLNIERGTQSGYFISMNFAGQTVKSSVSNEEATNMRLLLSKAVTRIFGW